MLRSIPHLFACFALVYTGACSDLGASPMSDGGTGGNVLVDPPPVDKPMLVGCVSSEIPVPFVAEWELSVDPTPISGASLFAATLSGTIVIPAAALEESLSWVAGGYKRLNLLEAHATVQTSGATSVGASGEAGSQLRPELVPFECTYDERGEVGPLAGPDFPPCDPRKDTPDGSNADCTPLGEPTQPKNRCGQFYRVPTSSDCEECGALGKGAACSTFQFCVTGDLRIPLRASPQSFMASEAGEVLFGLDGGDGVGPGVPSFDKAGPNGFRIYLQGTHPLAVECAMVGSGSVPDRFARVSDSDLIAFTVQPPSSEP